jgi:hypothetical protein
LGLVDHAGQSIQIVVVVHPIIRCRAHGQPDDVADIIGSEVQRQSGGCSVHRVDPVVLVVLMAVLVLVVVSLVLSSFVLFARPPRGRPYVPSIAGPWLQ